jgi:ABC-type transporter MlaC component
MKVRMRNAPFPARRSRLARGPAALCWRLALSAALLAGAQSLATAAEAPAAPRGEVDEVGAASDAAAVTRFIETFVADAVAILSDRALAPEARDEAFRAMLLAGFDTYGGARFVLGRGWRVATRDQRDEFVALFRAELLGKAKELFEGYEEGEVLEVVRVRRLDSGKFTVATKLTNPEARIDDVDFLVRRSGTRLQIVDVRLEGFSLRETYRREVVGPLFHGGVERVLRMLRPHEAF